MSRHRAGFAFARSEHSIALGVLLTTVGSLLLYDGFERRGKRRPWGLRFLPGP